MRSGGAAPARTALSDGERLAWIRLIRTDNIGPATFHSLLAHCGSAEAAIEALPALSRRGGAKKSMDVPPLHEAERELEAVRAVGGDLVALGEAGYPPLLCHVDAPPPLLSVRGSHDAIGGNTVAIVGARNASLSGRKLAATIAAEVGEAGYSVISGLALGIDGAAHKGAMATGTVAVFASGIDRVYPREHRPLMDEILRSDGAAISEMPYGWEPRARDFPRRNRIISGSALAVVVVEAAERSGSLHTARFAADQGREVLAVPGSPLDPRAAGCNRLIREGATLIASGEHVLSALGDLGGRIDTLRPFELEDGIEAADTAGGPADRERASILQALGPTPVDVDELIRDTGIETRFVQLVLLELEIAGRLDRHGRHRVSLLM